MTMLGCVCYVWDVGGLCMSCDGRGVGGICECCE